MHEQSSDDSRLDDLGDQLGGMLVVGTSANIDSFQCPVSDEPMSRVGARAKRGIEDNRFQLDYGLEQPPRDMSSLGVLVGLASVRF
eukprot:gene590-biopygen9169